MKFLLILVTFSQSPQGVYLQHVASFGTHHECAAFSETHNLIAAEQAEVLACMKVDFSK